MDLGLYLRCFFCVLLLPFGMSFFSGHVVAQERTFDTDYNEAYALMVTDVEAAFEKAQALFKRSKDDVERIRVLMLLANIQHSRGEISSSLDYVVQAQEIALLKGAPDWIARTSGFLATSFRNYGLIQESRKYLQEAEKANERQKTNPAYTLTKINILQEKSFHAEEEENFEEALRYLQKADELVGEVKETSDPRAVVAKATVYQLMGVGYFNLEQFQRSDSVLRVSLQMLGEQESNLRPYIFVSMAKNHLKFAQLDSAYHYLKLAEPYLTSSDREELKINFYYSYIDYYKATNNAEKVAEYTKRYNNLKATRTASSLKITNDLIKKLNEENQLATRKMELSWGLSGIIIIGGIIIVIYMLKRRRKEIDNFKTLLTEIEAKNKEQQEMLQRMKSDESGSGTGLAADTEKRLLYNLVKLEFDNFFLNPDISVPTLAGVLGTNTKYVTFLLRKYRKQDFNEYIQYQRIMYILNCLKNDPSIREYKLSYLAEMSGFSTHSMFSAAFKSVTGITPSSFIEKLHEVKYPKRSKVIFSQ